MLFVLRALAIAVPAITLLIAGGLALSNDGGGFIPNLGAALALYVLAAGVVVSWLLNLLYLQQARGPRWLVAVTGAQTLPVLFVAWSSAATLLERRRSITFNAQASAVRRAIALDDTTAFTAAMTACAPRCQARLGGAAVLRALAADAGSRRIMARLLRSPSPETSGVEDAFPAGSTVIPVCSQDDIQASAALAIAVARNDRAMVDLLLPTATTAERREAIWVAAQLDRLALLQHLAAAGAPLAVRGRVLDENVTLLHAAAEGAAVRVGRWLIEAQRMPVDAIPDGPDPYPGVSPIRTLLSAAQYRTAPASTAEFLALLAQHGANVNARWDPADPGSALTQMVRRNDATGARLLIAAGATRASLSAPDDSVLTTLLAEPARDITPRIDDPACVPRGD